MQGLAHGERIWQARTSAFFATMLASVLGVFATIVVATAIGGSGSNASLSKEFPWQFRFRLRRLAAGGARPPHPILP